MTSLTDFSITEQVTSYDTAFAEPDSVARSPTISTLSDICKLLSLDLLANNDTLSSIFQNRSVKPGQHIYRIGQVFESMYLVKAGFLKTALLDHEGNERVISFPMKGALLGSDGISNDRYASEVTALSDCELIVVPFRKLLALGHACKELEHLIYRAVSGQIVREQIDLVMLGSMRSDARVARFLCIQAEHHAAQQYSSHTFLLRMTRRDIGSYLGLTLETVSRTLSALHAAQFVSIDQRIIKILKPEALRSLFQSKDRQYSN